jgi:hypothetical protein
MSDYLFRGMKTDKTDMVFSKCQTKGRHFYMATGHQLGLFASRELAAQQAIPIRFEVAAPSGASRSGRLNDGTSGDCTLFGRQEVAGSDTNLVF